MSHEDCGLEIAVQFPPLLQNFLALLTTYPPRLPISTPKTCRYY
jgi:hypothetical protein